MYNSFDHLPNSFEKQLEYNADQVFFFYKLNNHLYIIHLFCSQKAVTP